MICTKVESENDWAIRFAGAGENGSTFVFTSEAPDAKTFSDWVKLAETNHVLAVGINSYGEGSIESDDTYFTFTAGPGVDM